MKKPQGNKSSPKRDTVIMKNDVLVLNKLSK
jgi:hypothetical protein